MGEPLVRVRVNPRVSEAWAARPLQSLQDLISGGRRVQTCPLHIPLMLAYQWGAIEHYIEGI